MKVCLLLAIFVAIFCYCEAKKHHKKDNYHDFKKDLKDYKRPSANPYHHGSKHSTGRLRGQHLQFKKHKKHKKNRFFVSIFGSNPSLL